MSRIADREPTVAALRTDERGSVTVEYAVLLATVALGCALAIAALGVPLLRMYLAHRAWLLLPMP
jgi:Flp pilus assembly pilin Flp